MRILVVDDDYVSRVKLLTLLGAYGQCDSAPNGEIAVKLFEEAHKELVPYDLVTMDIEMPVMNGHETIARMREAERALQLTGPQAVKILMVTVHKTIKQVASSYEEGCDGYLTKPTTPEDLKKTLAEVGFKS